MTARERRGPLDGLRVVDFSGMISGGFATLMLADFGADVVYAEHPDYPDPLREWPPKEDGTSLWWKAIARNKRCITLDLGSEEGREIALDLVADADVVFENFRPGTM
jgi:formyl-CoA transferase